VKQSTARCAWFPKIQSNLVSLSAIMLLIPINPKINFKNKIGSFSYKDRILGTRKKTGFRFQLYCLPQLEELYLQNLLLQSKNNNNYVKILYYHILPQISLTRGSYWISSRCNWGACFVVLKGLKPLTHHVVYRRKRFILNKTKQAMYVQRKNSARSLNHCCNGKAISIT